MKEAEGVSTQDIRGKLSRIGGRARIAAGAGALALALAMPAAAAADGGFWDILPGGQGQTVNASDLASYEATGNPPASFTNQIPLYAGLMYAKQPLTQADIERWFRPETFGLAAGDVVSTEQPRPGVTIQRDAWNVPHVTGQTRSDTEFGAGYASAEDRLFFMDVLRHTARGTLTDLAGPGTDDSDVQMDATQLLSADYTDDELQKMVDDSVAAGGAEGQQILQDAKDYVAGVNAYIDAAKLDPNKLPAEYPALGKMPAPWTLADSAAVATLIGSMFGLGGGHEADVSQVLLAAQKRFGARAGKRVFRDLQRVDDPEAPVTTTKRFHMDNPGRPNPSAIAMPDLGSIKPRNPIVSGSSAKPSFVAAGAHADSNALLVTAKHSVSGHPLAVMGPQVGYYSPEVLEEMDLHGGGIEARGAVFPGIGQYVLLGRGKDFAWSATSAESDNVDEFVEELCNADGSPPTASSDHYVYRGQCIPFKTRDITFHTGPTPSDPTAPPRTIVLRAVRSVHGPIQGTATVGGKPVAIASARSTMFHEVDSVVAFKRLNDGEVNSAQSFERAMSRVNFVFNWFYADHNDIAWFSSGAYPVRARGTDPALPAWGTGQWDWQKFDPATYTSRDLPARDHPHEIDPPRGYFTNWNTKPAHGWRSADDHFMYSSVHRSQLLEKRLLAAMRRGTGRVTLPDVVGAMEGAATSDLRGQEVYPWLRRVIGHPRDARAESLLRILDAWVAGGANRRDLNKDGYVDEGAAVALMDAWWPDLLTAIYQPVLGDDLLARLRHVFDYDTMPGPDGDAWFAGWYGYVDKDMRTLLGRRVRGPLSRVYCGGGNKRKCRGTLVASLLQAAAEAAKKYGSDDPSKWRVPEGTIQFTDAGSVSTPPMPTQNRPTWQQVVAP